MKQRPHVKSITTKLPPNLYQQDGHFRYRFTVAPDLRPFFKGAANVMGTLATLPPDLDAAKVEFAPIRRAFKARVRVMRARPAADLLREKLPEFLLKPAVGMTVEQINAMKPTDPPPNIVSTADADSDKAVAMIASVLPLLPSSIREAIDGAGGPRNFVDAFEVIAMMRALQSHLRPEPDLTTLPDDEILAAIKFRQIRAGMKETLGARTAALAPALQAFDLAEVTPIGPTLSFILAEYLRKSDLSPRTVSQNRGLLLRLIQHCGDIAADLVTPGMLNAFLDDLRTLPPNNSLPDGLTFPQAVAWAKDNPDEKRPLLKPTAANNYVAKIKAMFAKAKKLHLITSNPALDLEKSKDKRPKSRKVRRYLEEELSDIVRTASNHPTWHVGTQRGLLLMIALYSGARLQEPLGLRKRDIIEKAGSWFFHFEYNEDRNQKTVQSERDTPIHSAILPAVLARVAALKGDDALVFPSFPPARSHSLSRQFKTLCPPVGNVSPWHSFRHSFEWHAENVAKLRPVMIASLTGHNTAMYDTTPDHAQMVEAMETMYAAGFGTLEA